MTSLSGRVAVAACVVSSVGWSCTGSSTSAEPRRSTGDLGAWTATPPTAAAPSASARPPLGRWKLADTWETLAVLARRAPSKHLAEPVDAELRGDAPDATGPGAVRVEVLRRPGSDAIVGFFAMTRREAGFDPPGDDWEYAVARPDGELEALGRLPQCARCHAEAPRDHRFGR